MAKFTKPMNLNGYELRAELRAQNIEIADSLSSIIVEADGSLFLDIKAKDEEKAAAIVASHNGSIDAAPLSAAEKLQAAGLTVDDLKTLLGLNS